jgi:hypothetical protein
METCRRSKKTIIKGTCGGRKRKGSTSIDVEENIKVNVEIREPDEKHITENKSYTTLSTNYVSIIEYYRPFISTDFHLSLENIPIDRINDIGYIHFHIFTVWFLSNMNIHIPKDIHKCYDNNFKNFPFFSSLFHIRGGVQ